MNNLPRQKLLKIIGRYGHALTREVRRCEALMRDYFPAHRREIAVLTTALEERVPAELLSAGNATVPRPVLLKRLAQRLHDEVAMEERAARWAVHTWALALGAISPAELDALEASDERATAHAPRTTDASNLKRNAPAPASRASILNSTPPTARASSTFPATAHATQRATHRAATPARETFMIAADGSGDFLTLNDALKRAAAGARVRVRPGVYHEEMIIDKPIEIVGEGALEEIVVRATRSSCLSMRADAATVSNLTLRGQALRGGIGGEGFFAVDIRHGRLLLQNCDISSDSLSCIAIHGPTAEPVIRRCRVHHGVDSGIYVFDRARGVVEACDIFENSNVGVALTGGARTSVTNCHVHHGRAAGIVVWNGAANTIEDCDIYANASTGVGVSDQGAATLRRCRVHEGQNTGVFVHRNGQATIEECNIYRHAEAEVAATSGGNVRLHECQIHQGRASGVVVRDAGRANLEACDIFDNRESGLRVEAGGVGVARNCRINENGHVGVSVEAGGAVNVEDCDLTENHVAPWAADYGARVESRNNRL